MSEEIKLLPCPFCGIAPNAHADFEDAGGGRACIINCPKCDCLPDACYRPANEWSEATAAWNRRAHDGDGWRDIESADVERVARAIAADRDKRHYSIDRSPADAWLFLTDYARSEFLAEAAAAIAAMFPAPPQSTLEQEKRG